MDNDEIHEVEDSLQPEPGSTRATEVREGVPWGAILLLIWAVLLIVFSVQNADNTPVAFLVWDWEIPVALLVLITALATLVLTGVGLAFYRRRRRQRRQMKEALRSEE